MPKAYDLEQARHAFDTVGRTHLREASQQLPDCPADVARAHLESIVEAWLLGQEAQVREPLAAVLQWFEQANTINEQIGESPYFLAAQRNEAHGLALWLSNGVSSKLVFQTAVRYFERHFEALEPTDILDGSLDDYLACCLHCGEFARGAALYEKVGGRKGIADAEIQSAVHLGYWLCKSGRDGSIPPKQCGAIGARVLRANLPTRWLGMGQNVRAVSWLKIVAEFAQWKLSPHGVMQRTRQFFLGAIK